jgi:MerR family transcriptional regulator, light-induced transcriptional regulator
MSGKYTVNEVEERSKILASTLRQWERRYGFPSPERAESGYRLYSEGDLMLLEAMKRYIEDGVPASRAAELVKQLHKAPSALALEGFQQALLEAFGQFDEARADQLLSEAHNLHPLETVMLKLIQPLLVEVGELWQRGSLNLTTEHFASSYIQGRLRNLFNSSPKPKKARAVIVTCAPHEQHELGALMLAIMLRRAGYQVYYLGANTPVGDLLAMVQTLRPTAVLISATTESSLEQLKQDSALFQAMPSLVVFGGGAFERQPESASDLGGTYLAADSSGITESLERLLATQIDKQTNRY